MATAEQQKRAYEAMVKRGVSPEMASEKTGYNPQSAPPAPVPAASAPAAAGAAALDNLDGAEPPRARVRPRAVMMEPEAAAAPPRRAALPAGFAPVNVQERTWRAAGDSFPNPDANGPPLLESESPHSRTGRVVGISQDGDVIIEGAGGERSRVHISQLNAQDIGHLLAELPSGMTGRIQLANPEELARARSERDRFMWEEKTGFVGDGRDLADVGAKLAEFRRQRRAGLRPGSNAEQQYEMFGPAGDDAAARAEAQASIDAQVAAGAMRDKAVRKASERDRERFGASPSIKRYDENGEEIAAPPLTEQQKQNRIARREAEDRVRQDPSHVNAMIARLARAAGVSRDMAREMVESGDVQQLRDMAGSKRDEMARDSRTALRDQNMLAGRDPRKNFANAFGRLSPEWQEYVTASRMGADPGASPSDAEIANRGLSVQERLAEAQIAREKNEADRLAANAANQDRLAAIEAQLKANQDARENEGLGLQRKEAKQRKRASRIAEEARGAQEDLNRERLGLEQEAAQRQSEAHAAAMGQARRDQASEEAAKATDERDKTIAGYSLEIPAGAQGEAVRQRLSAGDWNDKMVQDFAVDAAIKLLRDNNAFDDGFISPRESNEVDSVLSRLGAGYKPGSFIRRAIDDYNGWWVNSFRAPVADYSQVASPQSRR